MDFILQDSFHEEHDAAWAIFSHHYHCPVCLGCIVETLEQSKLLCIQKKPAITELLRLLTHQSPDILQLFIQKEQIVWHLAEILLGCLKESEESYLSSVIDTCAKLVQQIGSEDLVVFFLDGIHQQVGSLTNHDALLPHYTLLGKMLYQLPPLAAKLLQSYDQLLHQISLDLSSPRETIQSAVAYLFIFLCDGQLMGSMSVRLKQQLHQGILRMLSTVQTQAVQVNGLGLLKKLLAHEDGSQVLMALNMDGTTLLGALKKLLLSKREVLQIGVAQILNFLLQKKAGNQYGAAILESDLAEFLFEALHIQNVIQMESTLTTLHQLSKTELFYKRCHAVYGVESVLRSLGTSLELKNPTLLKLGYSLLAEILQRQPPDIPLFVSSSVVKNCLSLIKTGIIHHQISVSFLAIKAASFLLRKDYLMLPVPFSELSNILTYVAAKAWDQLRDGGHVKQKITTTKKQSEKENKENFMQVYVNMLLNAVRLGIQCKSEPLTCESAFAAPSSGSGDSVPPLLAYIQTVFQIIDENCIPLFMIQWDNIELMNSYKGYFELLSSLEDLDQTVSGDIINKLVEAGCLTTVLEVKENFRRESTSVESVDRFLAVALKTALYKEETGTNLFKIEDLKETVSKLNWSLAEIKHVFCDNSTCIDKETVEAYITILYLCYKYDNRPIEAETLQLFLSWIVEGFTSLEQLSSLARKHYLFLLAWSVVNEEMDMRSLIPNGIQSIPGILNQSSDNWYTHDVIVLQWCYTDVVLATLSGTFVLKKYLEICDAEELKNSLSDSETPQQYALSELPWNPVFRQKLLDCIARGRTDIVLKARLMLEYHLQQVSTTDTNTDSQMTDNSIEEVYAKLTDVLQNSFLKNYPEAKEHNLISLLELMVRIQTYLPAKCVDIKILYHVLNQFGRNKELSEELKNVCLEIVAISVSSSKDNQVSAIVVQNEELLFLIETSIRENLSTFNVSCDILTKLIQSSNIVQVPYMASVHLPSLVNCIFHASVDTQITLLHFLASVFTVKLSTPVAKFTGRINPTNYRTFYIYLQQFIVQDICQLQESAVICLEEMIKYLLLTQEELGLELLSQPWNQLMLDILVELSLEVGWSRPTLKLLKLFLDNELGVASVTASKALPHNIAQCFHANKVDLAAEVKDTNDTELQRNLASLVLEKLSTFLTPAERNILQEITEKTTLIGPNKQNVSA